ncbi:DEAD/DEAH box helicase [Actinomadura sp. 7K534]|uniref:SNF2-related protein n=1 Tax=Actinomadura sp. 7K534 TaxID=2530366 RepID=UPI001045A218|nr:DEAD/DEAH box helicase [Actinomadura sp. 7K534]TDB96103.1 DEAD/DEAH box helicase [Actinomadura sp. 7K534]
MREHVGRVLRDAGTLELAATRLLGDYWRARHDVVAATRPLRTEAALERLRSVPVTRLKDTAGGPVRFGAVRGAELVSVAEILESAPEGLRLLRGVGPVTAGRLHGAAQRLATAAEWTAGLRIEIVPRDEAATPLVVALYRLVNAAPDLLRASAVAEIVRRDVHGLRTRARCVTWRRRLLRTRSEREAGWEAVAWLKELLEDPETALLRSPDLLAPRVPAEEAWRDYERRPVEYQAVLREWAEEPEGDPAEGFLPGRLAVRVRAQSLDETLLRVPLRGYQAFGARFALLRRRVILGDEPGLGKTLQAVAAIAHRRTEEISSFLVACPPNKLHRWVRDIEAYCSITVHPVLAHHPGYWLSRGGIAVAPFDALPYLNVPPGLGMLVVDEAHQTTNRDTLRATTVTRLCRETEHVMLLTGIPMDERVGDFRGLLGHLPDEAAHQVRLEHAALGSRAFRAAAAHVYLRRDQRDVLAELPDVVHVDELVPFSRTGQAVYEDAEGDVMAMRRAAYAAPKSSAKLKRLRELVGEAAANGAKVVVFSCFADVLATVHDALGAGTLGPVTRRTPATRREDAVAEFTAARGHAVLLSEVQVTLNLRGASVVIFCEPQADPGLEARAMGRVHGAGRPGTVRVHRLLTPGTVDERISAGEGAG